MVKPEINVTPLIDVLLVLGDEVIGSGVDSFSRRVLEVECELFFIELGLVSENVPSQRPELLAEAVELLLRPF